MENDNPQDNIFFQNTLKGRKIMAKENAILDKKEQLNEDLTESFDFDELEEKLQSQLEEELADMQFLAEENKPGCGYCGRRFH